MRLLLSVTVFALLSPAAALAELPVAYDVDAKAMKRGLRFGDPLAFDLFSQPDCKSGPVFSGIFEAGGSAVAVEAVKALRVRKAPKSPKVARLRAELGVKVIDRPLYLKVTGNGIRGLPGCQLQVPAVVGFPGPAGTSLGVYDANGQLLGTPVESFLIFIEPLGVTTSIYAIRRGEWEQVLFDAPGCTGNAYYYAERWFISGLFLIGPPDRFHVAGLELENDVRILSYLSDDGGCGSTDSEYPALLKAQPFLGELPFTLPVAEPLYYMNR